MELLYHPALRIFTSLKKMKTFLSHTLSTYYLVFVVSSFSSLVIFLITPVVYLRYFSLFVLIHLVSPLKVDEEGGRVLGTEELHSRPLFHLSTSSFQLQCDALKANSETSPHPQRTKAERTQVKCETIPFLLTLSSPFHQ